MQIKKIRSLRPAKLLYKLAPFAFGLCLWAVASGCGLRTLPPVKYMPLLGKEKEISTTAVLGRALDDPKLEVRARAVVLLGEMGASPKKNDKRAVAQALGKALGDRDPGLRLQAVEQLGRIESKYSNKYLITALEDPNIFVREKVVETLTLRRSREMALSQPTASDSLSVTEP